MSDRCFIRKKIRLEQIKYSEPFMVYFATLCARHHSSIFQNTTLAEQVVSSLLWRRESGQLKIYAYCLMPDHLHIAMSPALPGISLLETVACFKGYTTSISWKFGFSGQLWQRNWYDHIARQDEDALSICRYIIENPVRKGLVETCEDWPFSGMVDTLPI